ncbi:3-(methylthio)propionyl-CoA ligase [Neisseria leonii]|uniref:3-(methylthio)propionyl-CoA ligase n=1 Tax=Neisseria leonii TaxID=2995413 RepID=UPI00237C4DFB|nr:3-(methylthio)propionyl-CoA ligase [Neisseria sp. 3986]MDD9326641.1 3-(methylthio)propionyl-CoA ligase [Neisseria sp. 3986]
MLGLMQNQPLLISTLLDSAARHHGSNEIVSRRVEGDIHRYTWKDLQNRAKQVANGLEELGVADGLRVGTLAWNGYRHLELYYGVSGAGRVIHTVNPRLSPEQIAWIINHADDQVLCFDMTFLSTVQQIHTLCPSVKHYIALCDSGALPADSGIPNLICYEDWLAAQSTDYVWPDLDENTASGLCYTSGTTGNPKGVLYSHRSSVLHAYAISLPDTMCLREADAVLPVVPMFHVNAWGIPYAAAMVGCKLVLPGPQLHGEALYSLMEQEQVTFSAGVPTVWQMLLSYVQEHKLTFSSLKRVVIGGSAAPRSMIETFLNNYHIEPLNAWGMTELSPVGTFCTLKAKQRSWNEADQITVRQKQGRAVFGADIKILDENGNELPWDGQSCGELYVKSPWLLSRYFNEDRLPLKDGWFATGDIAVIDADGFMQITDRSKDIIKSGGEWISSITLENIATAHPAVAMAACIGIPHPKWDERPIVAVVLKPGTELAVQDLQAFYADKVAKWQIPDDVVIMDALPLGSTGKILKSKLREQLKDYRLPVQTA